MNGDDEDDGIISGACCNCLRVARLPIIVMLPRLSPTPGHGWGCVVCGLPCDGAVAVLCDNCEGAAGMPRFVCTGYATEPGRTPFDSLPPEIFEHDDAAHRRDEEVWQ